VKADMDYLYVKIIDLIDFSYIVIENKKKEYICAINAAPERERRGSKCK
jgi:hypothetical protein